MDITDPWTAREQRYAEPEAPDIAEITAPATCATCGRTTSEDLWGEGLCALCFDASMP
jgi:hypothetical protein